MRFDKVVEINENFIMKRGIDFGEYGYHGVWRNCGLRMETIYERPERTVVSIFREFYANVSKVIYDKKWLGMWLWLLGSLV